MPTYVTVSAQVNADDIIQSMIDQADPDDYESLERWYGKFETFEVDAKIDQEDAIAELPDERIKQDYRERYDGVEIEIEREFIDALKHARHGEWDIARALLGRMFQSYPAFAAKVDMAVSA